MGVAVKVLRIGKRGRADSAGAASPLELALAPALADGRWKVPDRFNFTRDVVDVLASNPKRDAVTFLGRDGVIEPRTFTFLSEGAARWATVLRERGMRPGDRVIVQMGMTPEWLEVLLACLKIGVVAVPCSPTLPAESLEVRASVSGASLIVAARAAEAEITRAGLSTDVHYIDEGRRRRASDVPPDVPTHDTSAKDVAFILTTSGAATGPRAVVHTHGAAFAARLQAEHWLDARPGDAVWCATDAGSPLAVWHVLLGPWSRGAEVVLHDGPFDPPERLDLIDRLGATILCQSPSEYRALARLPRLARFRPRRLRRLVSTGDFLDDDVVGVFEESWGLTIHDGYGQAETNVVVANGVDAGHRRGSIGLPLPGFQVAVVDDQGNELGAGVEGDLAVRGRPPSLFTEYWEAPDDTKAAFRGDWYVTGDVAESDEDGFLWLSGRAEDMIESRGRTFGPFEVEQTLRRHQVVAESAVVGVRDLASGGHFVRAFVVLEAGREASGELEAELRHFVEESLSQQSVPREIEFVEELPATEDGKIKRAELRERAVVGRPLWETSPLSEPEPVVLPKPEAPVVEPEPVVEPVVEPVAETYVEPIVEPVAEAYVIEPEPLPEYVVEPEPVVEPVIEPVAEPVVEPVAETYVEPSVEPVAEAYVIEPEPLPEYVVEPESVVEPVAETYVVEPEPVVEPTPEPAPELAREPEPEPKEDLGPLPDYVVIRDRDEEPTAPASHTPEFGFPRVADLGGLDSEARTEPRPKGEPRQPRTPEPSERRTKGRRSAPEPGEDADDVTWMQGLSGRLSAYSLESDRETPEDTESEPGREDAETGT
jgi:acyl-coenzyme A synthetase/AMP-(fatty) acid ligase